jgi:hypothetical protein
MYGGEVAETSEEDWRARNDAQTLADADAIKGDKERLARAQTAAVQIQPEAEKEAKAQTARAKALKRIAGKKK